MAITFPVTLGKTPVSTASASQLFVHVTKWGRSAGIVSARATLELMGKNGNLSVVPAFQLANDQRSPDNAAPILLLQGTAGWADADGTYDNAATLTTVGTNAKKWIRFGFLVKSSAGVATGTVSGEVEVYK